MISWAELSQILMLIIITENKNVEKWKEGQGRGATTYHNGIP